MAIPPRQFGSLFELQFPQSVGIYSSYEDAQKAVDFLADSKFEVQNLAIVGTDLKSVERVLGRRNWGTVITQGLQSGISTGLLVGLVMLIFTRPASVLLLFVRFTTTALLSLRTPPPSSNGRDHRCRRRRQNRVLWSTIVREMLQGMLAPARRFSSKPLFRWDSRAPTERTYNQWLRLKPK
jgi:hypothetical protein